MCSSSASTTKRFILSLALAAAIAFVPANATASGGGFKVIRASVTNNHAYFAGRTLPRLRYEFHSSGATRTVVVRVVNTSSHNTYERWTMKNQEPATVYERAWSGASRKGGSAPDGTYAFKISSPGRRTYTSDRFTLHNYQFPISGPHGTRGPIGSFGAPRSGGRTHRGFDVTASCGTPLHAVRAGKVVRKGYDPQLFGNFIEVNSRSSPINYFYAHLRSPATAGNGDRVKTGEVLGEVGLTGNAAGTPCHLHIEIRTSGRTVDPKPYLDRWDRYS